MKTLIQSLFICLLLLGYGCEKSDPFEPVAGNGSEPLTMPDTTISYLALGDSYTIGTSVPAADSWPLQLSNALATEENIAVDPLLIIARNGWRTDNLANAIDAQSPMDNFDMVSLLIGVNDQFQGFNVAGYRTRFEELLNTAISLAGDDVCKVFVVSIPDYAYTPFGNGNPSISTDIDNFNAAAREIAAEYKVTFLNITPISRKGLDDPSLVASDGLHPSGEQYKRWVDEVILNAAVRLIER